MPPPSTPSIESPGAFDHLLVGLLPPKPQRHSLIPTLATLALKAPLRPPPAPVLTLPSFDTWALVSAAATPTRVEPFDTWAALATPPAAPPVDPFASLLSAPAPAAPRPIPVKRGEPSRGLRQVELGTLEAELLSGEGSGLSSAGPSSGSASPKSAATTLPPAWLGLPDSGAAPNPARLGVPIQRCATALQPTRRVVPVTAHGWSRERQDALEELDPFAPRKSPILSVRPRRVRIRSRPDCQLDSPPVSPQTQPPSRLLPSASVFMPRRSGAKERKSRVSVELPQAKEGSGEASDGAHSPQALKNDYSRSSTLMIPRTHTPERTTRTTQKAAQLAVPKTTRRENDKLTLSAGIKTAERAAGENDSEDESDDERAGVSKSRSHQQQGPAAAPFLKAPVPRSPLPNGAGTCGYHPFHSPPPSSSQHLVYSRPSPRAPRSHTPSPRPPHTLTRYPQSWLQSTMSDADGVDTPSHTPPPSTVDPSPPPVVTISDHSEEEPWYTPGVKYGGKGSAYARYSSQPSPRLNIPSAALDGNNLQWGIMKSWQKAEPTDAQKAHLSDLLVSLTGEINRRATHNNPTGSRYIVDVFGSVAWGGATGEGGDVDLVIIDTDHPLGYEPHLWKKGPHVRVTVNGRRMRRYKNDKVPNIYNVHALKRYLDQVFGFTDTKAVPAFTPIVKFDVPGLGLQCDICTNDLGGWYNSCLVLAYCELSPFVLRPMIHVLKLWLESHNLNDPSGQKGPRSMSSYCITLMAIAYLQHIGVLPNLQAGVEVPLSADPRNASLRNTVWLSWGKDQGDIAHIWFERRPQSEWVSALPSITAAEAVRGFFKFFGRAGSQSFNPDTQIVSVLNGGLSSRRYPKAPRREYWLKSGRKFPGNDRVGKCDSFQPTDWDDQHLIVQDPFLWQKNCAKTLFIDKQDGRFFECVADTHHFLERNPNATVEQLLRV